MRIRQTRPQLYKDFWIRTAELSGWDFSWKPELEGWE